MINNVTLTGRLTKDAQIRKTTSGKSVASFTLAVDRNRKAEGQPSADYVPCVAWEKTAELIGQYCHKGSLIGVEGRIQTRSYDEPMTNRRAYVTEVLVSNMTFLESRNQTQTVVQEEPMVYVDPDEDLPF